MPARTNSIDQLNEEKKKQLVESITSKASEITGYPPEYFFLSSSLGHPN
jgi:phenylpyruvate tautomerase PptA (4-oxalocrotonate tautomerase family)